MAGLSFLSALAIRPVHRLRLSTSTLRCSARAVSSSSAKTVSRSRLPLATEAVSLPYACPRCRTPATPLSEKACSECGLPFDVRSGFYDLVPPELSRNLVQPSRQRIFQSPLVSFAYERGWRNQFAQAGFPGIDEEFKLVEAFFFGENPKIDEGSSQLRPVVDLSCGSGLMARRLVSSGLFSKVIAVDLSAAMLREALQRAQDSNVDFDAVRADVTRLPFECDSLKFVHAGAALHCWAKLQDALAEVHRVLEPGGKFFATTFLKGAYLPSFLADANADSRLQRLASVVESELQPSNEPYRFFEKDELIWLFRSAGFSDVSVTVQRRCAIVRCTK